jgi:hypothetical protein
VDPVAARVGLSGWPAEAAGRARTRAPWQRPSGPSGGGGRPGRARPRGPRFCCRIRRRTSGAPRTIGRRSRVVGPCPAVRGRPTMTEDRGREGDGQGRCRAVDRAGDDDPEEMRALRCAARASDRCLLILRCGQRAAHRGVG